jgi:hypothetical protein
MKSQTYKNFAVVVVVVVGEKEHCYEEEIAMH